MPLPKPLRLKQLTTPSSLTLVLVSLLLATPAVLFWLWMVIVPARVAVLCPEECKCEQGGYFANCSGPSLTAAPLIHLTNIRIFWLYENNITLLERDSFVSLTELEEFYIFKSGVRTIELGAFNGLTNLKLLYIWYNEISEIIPGTFENLSNVIYLSIDRNRLEYLDSGVFRGLVNLVYIDLFSNKLQYLHPDTFLGLPKLKHVNLQKNPSLQIPTDRSFINSRSLLNLYISHCNVSSLSVETFANASALNWLDLRHNNLETVDINILRALPKLTSLLVSGNPLQCDCQLQEVWRWCEDRKIQTETGERATVCDTPSEVKGMWWDVLEKGKCLEGNIQYYGDYNITSDIDIEDYESFYESDDDSIKQYQVALYAFSFVLGTTSNVMLLIIITRNKEMRTVPNMYILNLAVSDIIYLTVLFCEAFGNRISDTWLQGDFMCTFLPFCRRISVGLSAYSVAVFSFQRYRVTVNPLHVRTSSQSPTRVTVATVFGVWIVAALFAVPSAVSKYACEGLFLRSISYYHLVVIFELLVSCVLPLCVVVFSYVMTACSLVESSRAISEGAQDPRLQARKNTAKVVVGLAFVFMISYVPYHVLWTYFIYSHKGALLQKFSYILDQSDYQFQYMYLISTCFLLMNSCLNPVALFTTSSPFRKHFKRYLTCCCKTNSPPKDLELTRRC